VPYTLGVASSFNRFRFFPQEGVYQQATFFRRSAYEAAGGLDRGLQFIMDLDLFVRLAARKRFGRLPRLIAAFRMHGASKTSTLSKVWKAELNIFQQRYIRSRRVAVAGRALRLWYKTLYFGYRCLLLGLLRTGVVKLKAVEL
jgi:hypothetical protein